MSVRVRPCAVRWLRRLLPSGTTGGLVRLFVGFAGDGGA